MPRPLSPAFARAVRSGAPDGVIAFALVITHPAIQYPLRVINDTHDAVIDGELYIRSSFRVRTIDDVKGQIPSAVIEIANAGAVLNQWIERAHGGAHAQVALMQVHRPDPSDLANQPISVEWSQVVDVQSIHVDNQRVQASLGYDPLLGRPAVSIQYDPHSAPGVF